MSQDQSKIIADFNQFIEETWEKAVNIFFAENSFSPPYKTDFDQYLDRVSKEAEEKSRKDLQPWISIIEIAIQYLSSVHIVIDEARSNVFDVELLSPWALTGAACSQAVSIRKLCLNGLDASAKIILRSLVETLNILTITTYDPILRKQFQTNQEFEAANKFWRKYFRTQQVNMKLKEIMSKLTLDEETQNMLLEWQKEEIQLLHQTVHTSYIAAAVSSAVPTTDGTSYSTAIFGAPTIFSYRTLAFACKSIWLFSLIGFRLLYKPIDSSTPLLKPHPENSWNKIIAATFFVLNRAILRYWDTNLNDE